MVFIDQFKISSPMDVGLGASRVFEFSTMLFMLLGKVGVEFLRVTVLFRYFES